ncbi:DNA polymerase zeta catalytic subunit [Branchiostoma belcheri]|nr:DNA polymerase zeta catalytic subunit [Branchiostoma belcheri]
MDKGNSNVDMPADDTKRPAVWESHPSIHNNLTELGPRRQRSDSLPVKPQLTQPKKTPTQPANRQRSQSYSQPSDLRLRGDDRNTPPKFYCEAGRPLAEVSPDRHNIVRLKLKSKLQAVRHYSNHSPQGSPRSSSSQGSPLHSPTCGPRFSPLRRMSSPAEEANKRSSILLALLRGGKTAKQIEHEKNSPMSPTSSQSSVSEGSRSSSVGKDDVNIPETPDSDQRRPDNSTSSTTSTTSTPNEDCSKESSGENSSNGALSETKEEASSSSELQSPEKSTENTPTAPLKDNPESGHNQTEDPTNTPNSTSDMFKSMESCNSDSKDEPSPPDKKPTPKSSKKEDAPSSGQGPGKTYPSPVEPDGTNTVVIGKDGKVWTPALKPPAVKEVVESAKNHGLGESSYQEPFCSKPTDLPDKPM